MDELEDYFKSKLLIFYEKEKRAGFFPMSMNLIKKGDKIEGIILLLSTWNFGSFRYAVKDFDIGNFIGIMGGLEPLFDQIKDENFRTIHFDTHSQIILNIYNKLSNIKGVQHTGASKVMHLMSPKIFVMWDGFIRGEKNKEFYDKISINNKYNTTEYKKYAPPKAETYLSFLKDMQARFKGIKYEDTEEKSLTKAIDEFNYVTITMEIQKLKDEKKLNKKTTTKISK